MRFVFGHQRRLHPRDYEVEDRGFPTPCWIWKLSKLPSGYGRVYRGVNRRGAQAHRWMFEKHRGPIPKGHVLDHLCCNRECVNPEHLEPVRQGENVRRIRIYELRQELAAARATIRRLELEAEMLRQMGAT